MTAPTARRGFVDAVLAMLGPEGRPETMPSGRVVVRYSGFTVFPHEKTRAPLAAKVQGGCAFFARVAPGGVRVWGRRPDEEGRDKPRGRS